MVIFKQSMYSDKNFMNYMTFGYWMQPTSLMYIFFYIQKKKKKYLILSLVAVILIFFFGSRFSFMGSFLGILFLSFKSYSKKFQNKLLIIGIISLPFIITMYSKLREIIEMLIEILKKFKISTLSLQRLLFSLKGDGKAILTGRDFIYEETLKIFYENPVFGVRIFGFKNNPLFAMNDVFYPHNILLELILQYGIVAIIILGIIFLIIKKGIENYKSQLDKNFVYVLIILNLKLILTGTYLWEPYFWILLVELFKSTTKNKSIAKKFKKRI